jgi:hypothetical protein
LDGDLSPSPPLLSTCGDGGGGGAKRAADAVMASLRRREVVVHKEETLRLVSSRTRLLSDFATRRTLTGDHEAAREAREGKVGLMQLLDRGTQDRKELEALVCASLRERGRLLAFTSSELLLDAELVSLLGEADRREGGRRADAYIIAEEGEVTFDAYTLSDSAGREASFFKMAHSLGLVVGASVKSDLGFRNRRATSGELHADRCPILLFVLPRVDERAGAMSDLVVLASDSFPVSGAGAVRYVGPATVGGTLETMEEVRCACPPLVVFCSSCLPLPSFHQQHRIVLPPGEAWPQFDPRCLRTAGTRLSSSRWGRRRRRRWRQATSAARRGRWRPAMGGLLAARRGRESRGCGGETQCECGTGSTPYSTACRARGQGSARACRG